MCRSIKILRRVEGLATDDEVQTSALQFVRKISGYQVLSRANDEAFGGAVDGVATAYYRLLAAVSPNAHITGWS